VGSKVSGMLSTQKNPRSSNALTADDIPEPLRPVMITMSGVASCWRFFGVTYRYGSLIKLRFNGE
jgi:ABC-type uncharacterized transport system permease subunit